jgi:phosphoribosyl-AMP cyclohydrolase
MSDNRFPALNYNEKGLIPAVVQDDNTSQVLMVGWMNRQALAATLDSGQVHFWSRSRQQLWRKGETSGNVLSLQTIWQDCDQDTLLVRAIPAGPTCHTGNVSCFFTPLEVADAG